MDNNLKQTFVTRILSELAALPRHTWSAMSIAMPTSM